MSIIEVPVVPQITFSNSMGVTGTRKWLLSPDVNRTEFTRIVCRSHLPDYPDCIPIQVEVGPADDQVVHHRDNGAPRYEENMGVFPHYGQYQVVAHYALQRMTNCWPEAIPKPWHPVGTTLNLRVRNATQIIQVTPAGARGAISSPLSGCTDGGEALAASVGTRVLVPVTEYYLSCDRMLPADVDLALGADDLSPTGGWDIMQACVNSDWFMGCAPGTLLFDGYEIQETFACDNVSPLRYCMTACLKQRVITESTGENVGAPLQRAGVYVGWNHDYVAVEGSAKWDWVFIQLWQAGDCVPRYWYMEFKNLFGDNTTSNPQGCDVADNPGSFTEINETTLHVAGAENMDGTPRN